MIRRRLWSKYPLLLIAAALFLLSGCQAVVYGTASDFEKINLGMTKQEVIKELGRPVSVSADADKGEEMFVYKRMKHAISEWPRAYAVVFREGKVVRFGEQYHEHSVNQF